MSSLDDTVVPRWSIPANWEWRHIGEICDVIGGGTPKTSDPSNFDSGDIPWVTPADLSGYKDKYISRGQRNITATGLSLSSARMLPKGTVLFSSRAPIGYVAIAANPLATNQGFKSFTPSDRIQPDYLYYYLQFAKPLALELASGTTFQEISGKNAAFIPVALPPRQAQTTIVGKIEELFSDLDAGVAALKRAQANLKRYRASVLKAAVEGRLTEQWRAEHPATEPADKLLERILAERRKKWEAAELKKFADAGKASPKAWQSKCPEPAAPDTSNLTRLPKGWCWVTLHHLVSEPLANGRSVLTASSGAKVLRLTAIRNGRVDTANSTSKSLQH